MWAAAGVGAGVALGYLLGSSSKKPGYDADAWSKFFGFATTTEELVDSFVKHIEGEAPNNLKSFQNLRQESLESALAEAVVFGILQQLQLRPTISDVFAGGADFMCTYRPIWFSESGSWPLAVEATTLEPSAVERNSGWPNEFPEEISGGPFSLLTERITQRASDKVRQLSEHPMPRVLAIVSSHIGADAILCNTLAARSVLISDAQISVPIAVGETSQITNLEHSVFLRGNPKTREITAKRPSISAVLLVSVAGDQSAVLGILHPEPRYPLDISAFPDIPFIKVSPWPVVNGQIGVEWVVGQPSARKFKHRRIDWRFEAVRRAGRGARDPE